MGSSFEPEGIGSSPEPKGRGGRQCPIPCPLARYKVCVFTSSNVSFLDTDSRETILAIAFLFLFLFPFSLPHPTRDDYPEEKLPRRFQRP